MGVHNDIIENYAKLKEKLLKYVHKRRVVWSAFPEIVSAVQAGSSCAW